MQKEKMIVKCIHIAELIMFGIVVAALLRIDETSNVVSLENLVSSKAQQTAGENGCNWFSGRWVYDNVSYPLYKGGNCAMIGEDFDCEKYGRENLKYQNWRWQPHHCDLPSFNGTALLEKLRNKKLLFVGDSINRNQWRSLLCLIEPYLPPSTNKTVVFEGNLFKLRVEDYNSTIGFYWSPFLVESNADNATEHNGKQRTIRIKSIEKHGQHWIDADVLIFDTYTWWASPITILWGSFNDGDAIYQKVELLLRPYEIALDTWSDWLEFNIKRDKTKMFFMSVSPQRIGSARWGTYGGCYNVTEPIFDENYWRIKFQMMAMDMVGTTIEKLERKGVKVEYLNITQLSAYREDAHPSVYIANWKDKHPKLRNPTISSDCQHWCLPGVPDVWNQILYGYIVKP